MTTLSGKCSWFGGPEDKGVSPDEGLAFIYSVDMAPHLFLPSQPPGTSGLARRLDPSVHYVACRWDYDVTPKDMLLDMIVTVRAPRTGKEFKCYPADWGPHQDTGRVADLSQGLMEALDITTDDEVEVRYEPLVEERVMYSSICISSGHGLHVRGASGINSGGFDEVDEARKLVETVATKLRSRGVKVATFHDNTSTNQDTNLSTIVKWHNGQPSHDLDVSAHFNAFDTKAHGTEVLYVSEGTLASEVSKAISVAGSFTNRGGKKNTGLYFLNKTEAPAILLETCFCDSAADADLYFKHYDEICEAIAATLGGEDLATEPPTPPTEVEPAMVDLQISGDVVVTVNGKAVWP